MKSFKEKWNILLADDDQEEFELFQDALTRTALNCSLACVNHGEKLVEAIKNVRADVVFLDINMPGCDGMDCLEMIKNNKEVSHIPVIIYSTSNIICWVEECYELGASRYFIKPFTHKGLVKGLQNIFSMTEVQFYSKPAFKEYIIEESEYSQEFKRR